MVDSILFRQLKSQTRVFPVLGKAVAKFCAKFLHKELLTDEAYLAGDLSTSLRRVFLRLLSCRSALMFTLHFWCHDRNIAFAGCNLFKKARLRHASS